MRALILSALVLVACGGRDLARIVGPMEFRAHVESMHCGLALLERDPARAIAHAGRPR
jgi:hypothetical protein